MNDHDEEENVSDQSDSFEVDRHTDDQPVRDDLLDPEHIVSDTADGDAVVDEGIMPDPDELPESQGDDVVEAERLAEDASSRPLPSDDA